LERDGIVVGRQDYGEADRILRLLTPDAGRVAVIARGARSDRSRWASLDIGVRALVRPA
jgi:DNA repair protein RecO (recombination protein O)